MAAFPTLNGYAPSFCSIAVRTQIYDGSLVEMEDIVSITASVSIESAQQMAPDGTIVAESEGVATPEASWVLYRSGYENMLAKLAEVAPVKNGIARVSLPVFDVNVIHLPHNAPAPLEFRIKGCRVKGFTLDNQQGAEVQQVEMPLGCKQITSVIDGQEVALL